MISRLFPTAALLGWLLVTGLLVTGLLFAGVSNAADFVQSSADAPQYQLSNAWQEKDRFGQSVIAVDFRRTKAGTVSLSGASAKGPVSISAFGPQKNDESPKIFGG